jgi:hypothetical protein
MLCSTAFVCRITTLEHCHEALSLAHFWCFSVCIRLSVPVHGYWCVVHRYWRWSWKVLDVACDIAQVSP